MEVQDKKLDGEEMGNGSIVEFAEWKRWKYRHRFYYISLLREYPGVQRISS